VVPFDPCPLLALFVGESAERVREGDLLVIAQVDLREDEDAAPLQRLADQTA
jgi:hypothetical protein